MRYSRDIDSSAFVTVMADASFCPDTKSMGYAGWVKFGANGETRELFGTSRTVNHSFEAEVEALERVLEYVIGHVPIQHKRIVVQSDCIGALENIRERWGRRFRRRGAISFRTKHVKGHTTRVEPRFKLQCWLDKKAKEHMRALRDETPLTPASNIEG